MVSSVDRGLVFAKGKVTSYVVKGYAITADGVAQYYLLGTSKVRWLSD